MPHLKQKSDQIVAASEEYKKLIMKIRPASYRFMPIQNYSAIEIASVGQTSAHDPQSVQRSASIL